jgi:hypothetical protein
VGTVNAATHTPQPADHRHARFGGRGQIDEKRRIEASLLCGNSSASSADLEHPVNHAPRTRVHNFSISLDGFSTGEGQSRQEPFGHAGRALMDWFDGRVLFGIDRQPEIPAGPERVLSTTWSQGIGAEIMGHKKFDPQGGRGATTAGRAGGARSRRSIPRSSSSPTIPGPPSR